MATITPKELAVELGLTAGRNDQKLVRSFLRSPSGLNMKVGKGNRWAIERREVRGLKSRWAKWLTEREEAAAKRAEANGDDDIVDAEVVSDDIIVGELTTGDSES